ncbi:energy transducer TonB [Pseudoxanthomonas indica]|uniref:Protein TonB n=1 Tax=Pseudoxanthomonas indica TaxID=428993 RepID=A0A1T5KNH3_9GAMM|nr:energy transducer TonB [Pseudoxanthomonas indica]GGD50172.1 cell envelope biogenesis protein TonB [Pseudoxanthomonas indica]SKC64828.1 outer membrane transport energization protein TonB [Pseudoxanthomonas indica]
MLSNTLSARPRLWLPLLLTLAIAACSKDETAAPATAGQPAATTAATPPPPAVSAEVQAMNVDQLRDAATNALRENRIYAPGGNNAMEYYLALRDKLPTDPAVTSALTDLLPYTVIAAEQSITREEFTEAQRLAAIIEKADAKAPSLPRLKQSIASSQQAVAQRALDTEARTKAAEENRVKDQQRLAQQAEQQKATEAAAALQLAQQQEAARQEAARQETARREAEQREAAARATAQQAPAAGAPAAAPAAGSNQLRPISTPAPRYPPEALRAGTAGEVLVEFTVGVDGSVTAARVVRATPARVFDREAVAAAKRWRFQPVSEPVTTRRTIGFNPGG